jgi:hypothetical protein
MRRRKGRQLLLDADLQLSHETYCMWRMDRDTDGSEEHGICRYRGREKRTQERTRCRREIRIRTDEEMERLQNDAFATLEERSKISGRR